MAMDQNNLWTGFQMPRRLAADTETLTERYGRFYAQPFERGFGTTVGNSIRRALLSSIEGAAGPAVMIEGDRHEFSSFKGVWERKSADIRGDADVEVLDSDVHIATINGSGTLNIEMRLKRSRGYVAA